MYYEKNKHALVKVVVRPGEPLDKVVRRFKKLCDKEGIVRDSKRHEYFLTPGQRRRRKKFQALKRLLKELEPKPVREETDAF